jgi:Protein of unknown function (DUF3047)
MRHFVIGVLLALAVALPLTFVAPPTVPAEGDCRTIEDFSHAQIGEFPSEWKARKETGKAVYTVQEEGGKRFLRAVSKKLGLQAAREVQGWDLTTYPILAWSWRPREFPKGADERAERGNDSVLAVYMLVPHSRVAGPKAVKYIWSEKVPAGTRLSSNNGLTQVRVLESGPAKNGWTEERVNVLKDWKAAFKASETPKVGGIAILTDADDTKSTAAGDYAAFRACKG